MENLEDDQYKIKSVSHEGTLYVFEFSPLRILNAWLRVFMKAKVQNPLRALFCLVDQLVSFIWAVIKFAHVLVHTNLQYIRA